MLLLPSPVSCSDEERERSDERDVRLVAALCSSALWLEPPVCCRRFVGEDGRVPSLEGAGFELEGMENGDEEVEWLRSSLRACFSIGTVRSGWLWLSPIVCALVGTCDRSGNRPAEPVGGAE